MESAAPLDRHSCSCRPPTSASRPANSPIAPSWACLENPSPDHRVFFWLHFGGFAVLTPIALPHRPRGDAARPDARPMGHPRLSRPRRLGHLLLPVEPRRALRLRRTTRRDEQPQDPPRRRRLAAGLPRNRRPPPCSPVAPHRRRPPPRPEVPACLILSPRTSSPRLPTHEGSHDDESFILALDQGTTSSRAMLFDRDLRVRAVEQQEFPQIYPRPGWVEHDPEVLWQSQRDAMLGCWNAPAARPAASRPSRVANQRETVVVWNRRTGQPIHNAIVWQCRRTADRCEALKETGPRRPHPRKNRAGPRRLFLRHEDPMDPRPRRGRARIRPPRRPALRHGRLLADLETLRRPGACHRLHQRLAHDAVQHPHAALG